MARTVVPPVMRAVHQYLYWRDEEAAAKKLKDQATAVPGDKTRNLLKEAVTERGEQNGKDIEWLFDEPLTIGSATYRGLRNQAKIVQYIDEDDAQALVTAKGLTDRVRKEITIIDWDYEELYVLNQEGLITDAELDELLHEEISYSLVVMK